jgi:hypothetical protein
MRTRIPSRFPALLLLLTGFVAATPGRGAATETPRPSPAGSPPFARVYLALRGCTSCSHCRTTIRQMVRSQAGRAGDARVDGAARFTLRGTRQSFPVSIDRAVRRPPDGAPVRLTALVEGWREKGEISLVARQVRAGSGRGPRTGPG